MRIILYAIGALLILNGCVWLLQGFNVLLGSPMTGHLKWAAYGGLCIGVGVLSIIAGYRRRCRAAPG